MEYVRAGDLRQAFASMCSDVMKHDETAMHRETNQLGMSLLMTGALDTTEEMTKWIQGYN
jgi:hypothetical protein